MATPPADRERALRRRHKHERQAVIFGSLVAGLAVAALGSAAVYTGVVAAPFLDREFSSPPVEEAAELPDPPCPPEGTLPAAYNTIQVNVFNGADRAGLAGDTSEALAARGFIVLSTGNYPATLPGSAQLTFGEAGIAAAYSLAAQLDGPALVLDTRADTSVDLVLGKTFTALLDPATIVLDPAAPLVGVTGCVPLEQARESAIPAPTPTPAEGEVTVETVPEGAEPAPEG